MDVVVSDNADVLASRAAADFVTLVNETLLLSPSNADAAPAGLRDTSSGEPENGTLLLSSVWKEMSGCWLCAPDRPAVPPTATGSTTARTSTVRLPAT